MITRITIKSESGYGPLEKAYKDRLTITRDSIRFEYEPLKETPHNPAVHWTETSSDPQFSFMFANLCQEVKKIMSREEELTGTEHDLTTFSIMYDNGKKDERTFRISDDEFVLCFTIIDQMVKMVHQTP